MPQDHYDERILFLIPEGLTAFGEVHEANCGTMRLVEQGTKGTRHQHYLRRAPPAVGVGHSHPTLWYSRGR